MFEGVEDSKISLEDLSDPDRASVVLEKIRGGSVNTEIEVADVIASAPPPMLFTYCNFIKEFSPEVRYKFFGRVERKLKLYVPNPDRDFSSLGYKGIILKQFVDLAKESGILWPPLTTINK
jgi:hypothetical protein